MGERQFKKGFAAALTEGYAVRATAQKVNVPKSTVLRWCSEVASAKVLPGKSPGRPRKVTPRSGRGSVVWFTVSHSSQVGIFWKNGVRPFVQGQ